VDLYIILGLERGATLGDIKRAYKRLARKFHPDINPGDRMAAAQFRQIAEARTALTRPRSATCSPTCSASAMKPVAKPPRSGARICTTR
jgi:DnaJ-class molecular chaperone